MSKVVFGLLFLVLIAKAEKIYKDASADPKNNVSQTFSVLRIWPKTDSQLNILNFYSKNEAWHDLAFWDRPSKLGRAAEVMISSESKQFIVDLVRHNFTYQVPVSDVKHELSELTKAERINERLLDDSTQNGGLDFNKYQTLQNIERFLIKLANDYPELVHLRTLGYTHENRAIYLMEIEKDINKQTQYKRPIIFIDGGIHAREWVAPHVAMYLINKLVSGYGKDAKITSLLKIFRFAILPVANPDGYQMTWTNKDNPRKAFWRKNKSPVACHRTIPNRCCGGVDLNRNFDIYWGGEDTSSDPCSEIYPGTNAFSEPETRAIRNYIVTRRKHVLAYFAFHSYSQILAYSSAAHKKYYPADVAQLRSMAMKATAKLRSLYGTDYEVGSSADVLYPASGTALDWAKEKAGVKYSYLMELRPKKEWWYGLEAFFLKEELLVPTGEETWAGISEMAIEMLKERRRELRRRQQRRNRRNF